MPSDSSSQRIPQKLPEEAYVVEDDEIACSGVHDGEPPRAEYRVDFNDAIGDGFVAVCDDHECIFDAALFLEDVEVLEADAN